MHITQGDNNVTITFFGLSIRVGVITGATITVSINRAGVDVITKQATIVDTSSGQCSFTLTSSDLTYAGTYEYQWTVTLPSGSIFTGGPAYFYVAASTNPNVVTGSTPVPLSVQVNTLTNEMATKANQTDLTSVAEIPLLPNAYVLNLQGLTIGNCNIPTYQVKLGTITLG